MAQAMRRQMGDPSGEAGEEDGEGEGAGLAEGGEQGADGPDRMQALGQGRDPLGRRLRKQPGGRETGAMRVPEEGRALRSRAIAAGDPPPPRLGTANGRNPSWTIWSGLARRGS